MSNHKSKEIRLKRRPTGMPTEADFEVAEVNVPNPGPDEVLVRNAYMTVDPYMRGRMVDRASYVPPFQIGEALQGGAIGQVVASNNAKFKPGDYVQGMNGWREWYVSKGNDIQAQPMIPDTHIYDYLGALGMPGMTAYAGLLRIGELKDGERVFVSAAAGAVGSIVCQIAKAKGCHVVGSVGSDAKAEWLQSLGVKTINYKTCGDLNAAVAKAFPEGIDVYFENVGGTHLVAAINNMRPFGRIAACGMIEQYNATEPPPGPPNMIMTVGLSLKIQGFIVSNHYDLLPKFFEDMGKWIKEGKMKWKETIYDGIEKAPSAFIGLFKGENMGKALVRVGPDKAF